MTRYATSTHRRDLLDGFLDALRSLKTAGCRVAYLDGSFVTAKEHPRDGELFPADWPAQADGTTFRDLFQRDHVSRQPKGIIAINLAGLP